ncbi:hypothetical protein RUM44_009803 [Polyplax serrata]|uniref:Cytochrome P450 n=1 Tax=Polyplax serrata TaxID=468196 RepID=A0ABR1ATT0_POLSC
MFNPWLILFTIFLIYVFNYWLNWKLYRAVEKFPGPTSLPLLGNSLDFATTSHGIFLKFIEFSKTYGRFFRVWNNGKPYIICNDHRDAEVLLGSNVHLHKNEAYKYLIPWIGHGLISARDVTLWRKHRKIITPTFHFKILNDFFDIFAENAKILSSQLKSEVGNGPFDIHKYMKLAALDNICETAMGINMNAQRKADNTYVKAVENITAVVTLRMFKVWLMIDALFHLSIYSKIQKKCLEVLHGTTQKVIADARQKFDTVTTSKDGNIDNNENFDEKKRLAFLHLLLKSEEGSQLSDKVIREEVETFMFAGHDTISSGMSFTLYCLAQNPEIQEMVFREQNDIFGDSDRLPTMADVQEMQYLDRVVKEAQRVFPSIPFIGRELHEDLTLPGNYMVPKGTQLCINIFSLHHNPNVWTEPDKFNPDNFLPETAQSRHPYAFIPFSAGPRNCIGQKYAMLAMKVTLSTILRSYKINPSPLAADKPMLAGEIVLLSKNGVRLSIEPRKK